MKTKCKDCVFADYQPFTHGLIQIGCLAHRLEKFESLGETITMEGEVEKVYSTINNRRCNMYCTIDNLANLPMAHNRVEQIRTIIGLKNNLLVLAEEGHTPEQIKQTITTAAQQLLKPERITLILNSDSLLVGTAVSILREIEEITPFNWKMAHIQDRGPNGEKPSSEWCVDHVISGHGAELPTYSVFEAGRVVPPDYLYQIDKALNDDLDRFVVLMPTDLWHGAFVFTLAHQQLNGNTPEKIDDETAILSVMDKAHWKAKQEGVPAMVRKVEEICPSILK